MAQCLLPVSWISECMATRVFILTSFSQFIVWGEPWKRLCKAVNMSAFFLLLLFFQGIMFICLMALEGA